MSDNRHSLRMPAEKRFTFRAEETLAKALADFCRSEDLKPSQVFRKALKHYFAAKKDGRLKKAA